MGEEAPCRMNSNHKDPEEAEKNIACCSSRQETRVARHDVHRKDDYELKAGRYEKVL